VISALGSTESLLGYARVVTVSPMVALIIFAVLVLLVIGLLFWAVATYNKLVRQRNQVQAASSQIDVQLKRRHDLIPNLVETVKGYAAHESGTLEAVTRARAAAVAAKDAGPAERAAVEGELSATLSRLLAVSEAYPDLKANQNMMQLSEELTSTENRVAFARQAYNDSVMTYNNRRETFPTSVLAGMFHFGPAAQWEIAPGSPEVREAPKVQF
jgi:LemA protein